MAFLFTFVHGWIFSDVLVWPTRDMTVERTSFVVRLLGYPFFGGAAHRVQHRLRLRAHPNRRRGSPQCNRGGVRGRPIREAACGGGDLGYIA